MLHFLPVLIILSFQGIVFHSTFYGENPETKVQKKKTVFELSSLLCLASCICLIPSRWVFYDSADFRLGGKTKETATLEEIQAAAGG